ncbi:hypothetical protein ACFX12_036867 [Malus domestica]
MASASSPATATTTTMGTYSSLIISTNSFSAFLPNKSQLSFSGKSKHYIARRSSISCKATNPNYNNEQDQQQSSNLLGKLDRRNVLIGLGGLYGATTLAPKPLAFANPLAPPDLTKCKPAEITTGGETVECCPPVSTKIKTFTPDRSIPLRTRPAAHLVTDEYLAKFKKVLDLF